MNIDKNQSSDFIYRIRTLIRNYKEVVNNKDGFNNIIKDKEGFENLFKIIGDILTELKNSNIFNKEIIEKINSMYQDIVERYNSIYENALKSEQSEFNDIIELYNTKPKFTFEKYGNRQPLDEELKIIPKDIEEVDKEYKKIEKNKSNFIQLCNDIDFLVIALNDVIDKLDKKFTISQEQDKKEEITQTELMPIKKQSWIGILWNKIKSKLKKIRGIDENVVVDVPYIEIDLKNTDENNGEQELVETTEDIIKYCEVEPLRIQWDFIDDKELKKWEEIRLIEYSKKIENGNFELKDMPDFIRDYSFVDKNCENENYIYLKRNLNRIKK